MVNNKNKNHIYGLRKNFPDFRYKSKNLYLRGDFIGVKDTGFMIFHNTILPSF